MELSGRTAFITGGGRGIGRACALAFAKEGARVVVAARTRSEVEKVAAELRETGASSLALSLDVTEPESVQEAFKRATAEMGTVEILINNAGIARSEPLVKCTEELWQEIMEVNLTGTFRCTKAAL